MAQVAIRRTAMIRAMPLALGRNFVLRLAASHACDLGVLAAEALDLVLRRWPASRFVGSLSFGDGVVQGGQNIYEDRG